MQQGQVFKILRRSILCTALDDGEYTRRRCFKVDTTLCDIAWHGIDASEFQNLLFCCQYTETATRGILKNFVNLTENNMCLSLFKSMKVLKRHSNTAFFL